MSVLWHLCRRCRHRVDTHTPAVAAYVTCPCCRSGDPDADPEPVEFPTSTSPGGRPEPLWPPGSVRNAGTIHRSTTCSCPACHAAYARATRGRE